MLHSNVCAINGEDLCLLLPLCIIMLALELLHQFTSDEQLDGELYMCSQCCGEPQAASKKLSVSQLPEVL